jgi:cation diffusion facilitator family transporter
MLSIAAAIATLVLKFGAYFLTGSVGLLSDAVESSANLIAAMTALGAIWYAARPVDRDHQYGHEKIEFFASAVEGSLVLLAAVGIVWVAVRRLLSPAPIEALGVGSAVALAATLINLVVARILLAQAQEHDSLVLEADGRHLMTDVLTSIGVVVGLALARITGFERLDALMAIAVGLNILWTGNSLLRVGFDGLMDRALPADEQRAVRVAVEGVLGDEETYHALRTRRAGSRRFVDLHLLVPGQSTVQQAHELANRVEDAIETQVPGAEASVHVEPIEDRGAWQDSPLLPIEEPAFATPGVVNGGK